MTTRDEPWPQGTPCWVDGMVPDAKAGKEFYSELFGWEMAETGEEYGGYLMANLSGRPVAGLGPTPPDSPVPPVWTTYIAVDDVDAITSKITDHGGQLMMGPMDVMSEGRMAVVADPTGAVFGLWQADNHKGAGIVNEPGALTWNECMTRDYDRARQFYADVFGYDLEEIGDDTFKYTVLNLHGNTVGGVGEMPSELPAEVPPHWMSYFAVSDTDQTLEHASKLGATVRMPAQDTPYGRMAVVEGAQGEMFAVISAPQP